MPARPHGPAAHFPPENGASAAVAGKKYAKNGRQLAAPPIERALPCGVKRQFTPHERAQMMREYEALDEARPGSVQALAKRWGVGRNYFARFANKFRETVSFTKKKRTCTPYKLTEDVKLLIAQKAEQQRHDWTYEEMSLLLKEKHRVSICPETIRKMVKNDATWHTYKIRDRPTLNAKQMEQRMSWALENKDNPWNLWIDIDEKWFHGRNSKRIRKRVKWKRRKWQFVRSRSNVACKQMFLVAVAKPIPERGFNGKIGCWRVAAPYTARRKSANHDRGETYQVSCTMTGEKFRQMMATVVKSIRKKLPWADSVTVQMDGARCHTGKGNLQYFQEHYKRKVRNRPRVTFVVQPPNSPEMNVCDLALFPSMSTLMSKKRVRPSAVSRRTQAIWRAYDPLCLTKAFAAKSRVLEAVIANKGNNDFILPHSTRVSSPVIFA